MVQTNATARPIHDVPGHVTLPRPWPTPRLAAFGASAKYSAVRTTSTHLISSSSSLPSISRGCPSRESGTTRRTADLPRWSDCFRPIMARWWCCLRADQISNILRDRKRCSTVWFSVSDQRSPTAGRSRARLSLPISYSQSPIGSCARKSPDLDSPWHVPAPACAVET